MNTINVIGTDSESRSVEFDNSSSLMEVLRDAGYDEILAMCGGCCSCATCHVKIEDQNLFEIAPIEEDEEILVSMADEYDESTSRLSCQVSMGEAQNGMTVTIVAPD